MNIPKRQVHDLQMKYQLNIKLITDKIDHQKHPCFDTITPIPSDNIERCCADNEKSDSHASDKNTSESNPQSNISLAFINSLYSATKLLQLIHVKLRNHLIISEVDINEAKSHIFVAMDYNIGNSRISEYNIETCCADNEKSDSDASYITTL